MKDISRILLKYIFITILLFIFIFLSIFFYNYIPLLKIYSEWNELKKIIIFLFVPTFFHSFYNSLIISVVLFNVILLNREHKHRFIKFFIPIIISTFLVFAVQFYMKPSKDKLVFLNKHDARLFFTPDVFISHYGSKFLFKSIKTNKIETVIRLMDSESSNIENRVSVFHNVSVTFDDDEIYLELLKKGKIERENFTHEELQSYNIHNSVVSENTIKYLDFTTSKFLFSKNLYMNIFLWFCVSFFLLSTALLIRLINYPFLSLIYNFLFLIVIYIIFYYMFDVYFKIFYDIISSLFYRELFICFILLILGLVAQIFRVIFFRPYSMERE